MAWRFKGKVSSVAASTPNGDMTINAASASQIPRSPRVSISSPFGIVVSPSGALARDRPAIPVDRGMGGSIEGLVEIEAGSYCHPLILDRSSKSIPSLLGIKSVGNDKVVTDEELVKLWGYHKFDGADYVFHAPEKDSPGPDDGEVILYWAQFSAGLTLPIDPFIESMLIAMGISVSSLTPHSVKRFSAFAAVCRLLGREPSPALFGQFFIQGTLDGWSHFTARSTAPMLFGRIRDRYDGWESRMFFVEARKGFGFPRTMTETTTFCSKTLPSLEDKYDQESLSLITRRLNGHPRGFEISYVLRSDVQYYTGSLRPGPSTMRTLVTLVPLSRAFGWPIHKGPLDPKFSWECKELRCCCPPAEVPNRFIGDPDWSQEARLAKDRKNLSARRTALGVVHHIAFFATPKRKVAEEEDPPSKIMGIKSSTLKGKGEASSSRPPISGKKKRRSDEWVEIVGAQRIDTVETQEAVIGVNEARVQEDEVVVEGDVTDHVNASNDAPRVMGPGAGKNYRLILGMNAAGCALGEANYSSNEEDEVEDHDSDFVEVERDALTVMVNASSEFIRAVRLLEEERHAHETKLKAAELTAQRRIDKAVASAVEDALRQSRDGGSEECVALQRELTNLQHKCEVLEAKNVLMTRGCEQDTKSMEELSESMSRKEADFELLQGTLDTEIATSKRLQGELDVAAQEHDEAIAALSQSHGDKYASVVAMHLREVGALDEMCRGHIGTISDLQRQVASLGKKTLEDAATIAGLEKKIVSLKGKRSSDGLASVSEETLGRHRQRFVDEFKMSSGFHELQNQKMDEGILQGKYEILRHAAMAKVKTEDLVKWFSTPGCIRSLRAYHYLFPFSMSDCIDTREIDRRSLNVGRLWTPPPIVRKRTVEYLSRGSCSYVPLTENDIKKEEAAILDDPAWLAACESFAGVPARGSIRSKRSPHLLCNTRRPSRPRDG